MLIGKNLVQNKEWSEPKEYDRIYFDYLATDAVENYSKTQKTDKGRADVQIAGKKWEGTKPVEIKFSERKFATSEEKNAFIDNLLAEAMNKFAEIYPNEEPGINLLQAAGDGLDQWTRNALVGKNRLGKPQSPDEAKANMFRDMMRTGQFTEKQARKRLELLFAPVEDDEDAAA